MSFRKFVDEYAIPFSLLVLAVSGVVLMVVGTYVTVEAMLSVACNPL